MDWVLGQSCSPAIPALDRDKTCQDAKMPRCHDATMIPVEMVSTGRIEYNGSHRFAGDVQRAAGETCREMGHQEGANGHVMKEQNERMKGKMQRSSRERVPYVRLRRMHHGR